MFSYVNYILFRGDQYTPRYSLGAAPQNACLFSPLSFFRDLFSKNTILFLLFRHFAFMLSN